MVETIEVLAKTPLPTLLVIAGMFFIFVGIGGGFGAHIVADKVKPKLAFLVGGILLSVGVLVYVLPTFSFRNDGTKVSNVAMDKQKIDFHVNQKEQRNDELRTGSQSSVNEISKYLDYEELQNIFPNSSKEQIQENYPFLIKALAKFGLADKTMLAVALATISAENKSLMPAVEQKTQFNTSPGGNPFDLYDFKKDLGNNGPNDGSTFKGRGYLRLTGRQRYEEMSEALGYSKLLVDHPDKALDPQISAEILVFFLRSNEAKIRKAADNNTIMDLRRQINGSSHGLDRFEKVYKQSIAYIETKGF